MEENLEWVQAKPGSKHWLLINDNYRIIAKISHNSKFNVYSVFIHCLYGSTDFEFRTLEAAKKYVEEQLRD